MQTAESYHPMPHDTAPVSALNPAQIEAVEAMEGAVLVLAGAGTGKTKVLTTRLAHILKSGRAFPSQILAVTFTNKAAQEMKSRVSDLLGGQPVEGWWLGTFHALAARMLRRHAELVGLSSNFTIIDPDDQIRLIKQLMDDDNIDPKKNPPKVLIGQIDRWKDKALRPSDLKDSDGADMAGGKMVALYRRYQDRLRAVNACDFGDLLLHVITILRDPRHADVLAEYHKKFKYIMVDEYQDTNVAQYMWLRLLAKASGNICCVGDDDQSIYGWRGAEVGNILRFEQDFPNAKIIRLEENYRSTGHILAAANALIAMNEGRLGKTLFTSSGDGEKVTVQGLWDGEAEARWIGEEIEQLQKKQWALKNIAVLVRAGFQMREFEERFMQLNIPYKVIGGPRFYERQEIRDALAYFRIIVQPADDLALERIINVPKRGIGDSTVQTLYAHARATGICLQDSIYHLSETDELPKRAQAPLMALMDNLRRWRELLEDTPHTQVAAQILEESGYLTMWKTDKNPDSAGRVENLKELISGMAEFESLPHFLEHVALVLENRGDNDRESVSIMTLHGAKGLEFDAVFLPGWEEGLFPSQRSMDGNGLRGLEEERRLAYVGITRARKKSYVSYAANRRMYGSYNSAIPSRFVDELPEEHIETASATGIYDRAEGRSRHWDSSGIRPSPQPSPLREREATQQTGEGFSKGTKVTHDKFGTGTVIHIDGHKLDIQFDVGGMKRVMDSFVEKITS